MACVIYPLGNVITSDILLIALQIICGGLIYIGISVVFKIDSFEYLFDTVKRIIKREC